MRRTWTEKLKEEYCLVTSSAGSGDVLGHKFVEVACGQQDWKSLGGTGHIHVQKDDIKAKAFKLSAKLVLSTAFLRFLHI